MKSEIEIYNENGDASIQKLVYYDNENPELKFFFLNLAYPELVFETKAHVKKDQLINHY